MSYEMNQVCIDAGFQPVPQHTRERSDFGIRLICAGGETKTTKNRCIFINSVPIMRSKNSPNSKCPFLHNPKSPVLRTHEQNQEVQL